ncbi:hydroxysqualene dehydroxylase HpnE [Bombella sp. TMW 2.2543]|uniref:Hydroxysqualene dehydroxylase HpnE n=1 Tax=Bombella pluederhausensis TaxID=2967336 RepID=A0ABT3WI69_9PROT|nr:hydroxysqualene dehydroxylase HpnE [Bombella pluederhausensis]MCX5617507.1 hydroxysqualene dehydroxylase HpnE [Bombella pluederhausensis]
MSHVHIIGGGLAGLSAAVELAPQAQVTLYEAGPACGGRARSFHDKALDTVIDNGNHLLLSANPYTFRYLDLLGARETLRGPGKPIFPWYDVEKYLSWTLRLSSGRIPFWLLGRGTRVPGMTLKEVMALSRLMKADEQACVADCLLPGEFSRRLLEPLAISALNTDIKRGSARLLGNIVRQTLAKGGSACCPWMAAHGLSESFVTPAMRYLESCHAEVLTGTRVSSLRYEGGRVIALETPSRTVALGAEDAVIMAVPSPVAVGLVPGLEGPDEFESIANAHYRLHQPLQPRGALREAGFMGLVGGVAEWVFLHDEVLSVTVSAANRYADWRNEDMLERIWAELHQALDPLLEYPLPEAVPEARLIREKRATFAATPEQDKKRPGARTAYANLALAGDWTDTGLPSTIEGAIQSGLVAVGALGFRTAFAGAE